MECVAHVFVCWVTCGLRGFIWFVFAMVDYGCYLCSCELLCGGWFCCLIVGRVRWSVLAMCLCVG